jgi:uncharacterized protein (TIGR00730 family)
MSIELRSICVYCGSADGLDETYVSAAHDLGRSLAERGIRLVYGAGKTGLMGAVADGALAAGGEVWGIISTNLNEPQLAHGGLSRVEILPDIQARKARMSALADAFIALPGGYGTFDELFETLAWAQIGLHHKPIGLLNARNYFQPLLALVDHACQEGFIYPEHRDLIACAEQPEELLHALENFTWPSGLERWITREG